MQYRSLGRSTVLGIKEQTNQTQNGTRCGPSLSIDTRRDAGMGLLRVASRAKVPEAVGGK